MKYLSQTSGEKQRDIRQRPVVKDTMRHSSKINGVVLTSTFDFILNKSWEESLNEHTKPVGVGQSRINGQ